MSILIFLIILFVLVLVHEYGHFVTAKFFGMPVEEFGFGFPPRAMKLFKKGETLFTLNWLPLGGFVKISGEDPTVQNNSTNPKLFSNQPWYAQTIVLLAGVFMNFVLAWFLISGSYFFGAPTNFSDANKSTNEKPELTVLQVSPNSPANLSGIVAGDVVVKACIENNCSINTDSTRDEFISFVRQSQLKPIVLTVINNKQTKDVEIKPIMSNNLPMVGLSIEQIVFEKFGLFESISKGFKTTYQMSWLIVKTFGTLIHDSVLGKADVNNLTGPIGLVSAVGSAYSIGLAYLISLTALISLNLAVINLVPFPALDGGRLLFILIETITRKKIKPQISQALNTAGFFLLIGLMIFISFHDVLRLIK